jgi:acetyl-CoA acetyltransferase
MAQVISDEIQEDDVDVTKEEHKARRETLDDVLGVDVAPEEDDGADDTSCKVMCAMTDAEGRRRGAPGWMVKSGSRRKEKGSTRRTWKRGSMESKSDPCA